MLCVGRAREEDAVAPCLAVPGAPLVVDGHLAAIQSWGYGCGYEHDLPLVYTSMQYHQPWLLHNVPLIRLILKENLTLLFEAKRASILSKWLNMTRIIPPQRLFLSDNPMDVMKLDKELAKLRGHILDIRDFIYDGIHHKYKTKLYEKLRQKIFDKENFNKIKKTRQPPLVPFLNTYKTTTFTESETLFVDNTVDHESDRSYEEDI